VCSMRNRTIPNLWTNIMPQHSHVTSATTGTEQERAHHTDAETRRPHRSGQPGQARSPCRGTRPDERDHANEITPTSSRERDHANEITPTSSRERDHASEITPARSAPRSQGSSGLRRRQAG
jgi:hypothetical protein